MHGATIKKDQVLCIHTHFMLSQIAVVSFVYTSPQDATMC